MNVVAVILSAIGIEPTTSCSDGTSVSITSASGVDLGAGIALRPFKRLTTKTADRAMNPIKPIADKPAINGRYMALTGEVGGSQVCCGAELGR